MRWPARVVAVLSRRLRLVILLFVLALQASAPLEVGAASGEVHLLTVDGVINPLTAQYLARELREADDRQAGLVVVHLNTPGGLESAMREMTQAMLASPVPVVVYVAPQGARAASAGMFITMAKRRR